MNREIKDHRYPNEKLTTKAAKEMYEHSLKIESEYKHLINGMVLLIKLISNIFLIITFVFSCDSGL